MPHFSRTPGEKPSETMSDMATSRRAISSPFGCRTLSERPSLPGFLLLNWPPMSGSVTPGSGPVAASRAARPPIGAMAAIRVSGLVLNSTLITSAPSELRNRVPPAEARYQPKSSTRTPLRGNGAPSAEGVLGTSPIRTVDRRSEGAGRRRPVVSVRSASSGARRPGTQPVSVATQRLVA